MKIYLKKIFHYVLKRLMNEKSDNWGPHENELLCNMFVSALPMICLFATFCSFLFFLYVVLLCMCYVIV